MVVFMRSYGREVIVVYLGPQFVQVVKKYRYLLFSSLSISSKQSSQIDTSGGMVEPTPFSMRVDPSTDTHDMEFDDQISKVDELGWIRYGDKDALSGTVGSVKGSADGWTHGGVSIYWNKV